MKTLLASLALILLLAGCDDSGGTKLGAGAPAPSFAVPHLDGRTMAFPADFTGKAVALRFWADWCPFCRQEMTDIEPVYREFKEDGLVILAINVGQDRATAEKFMKSLGVTYDGLLDEDSAVAGSYHVVGLPTTFFVDRKGVIQGKILGESDAAAFRAMLRRIL